MKNSIAIGNYIVIALTILLFVLSLFLHGITHDLFLESGVLLVSIKLIMMNYKNMKMEKEILKQLNEIKEHLKKDSVHSAQE